jgi:hypothetical protein
MGDVIVNLEIFLEQRTSEIPRTSIFTLIEENELDALVENEKKNMETKLKAKRQRKSLKKRILY